MCGTGNDCYELHIISFIKLISNKYDFLTAHSYYMTLESVIIAQPIFQYNMFMLFNSALSLPILTFYGILLN